MGISAKTQNSANPLKKAIVTRLTRLDKVPRMIQSVTYGGYHG